MAVTFEVTQKSSEKDRALGDAESQRQQSTLALALFCQIYIQIAEEGKLNVFNESVVRNLAFESRAITSICWRHQWHAS